MINKQTGVRYETAFLKSFWNHAQIPQFISNEYIVKDYFAE